MSLSGSVYGLVVNRPSEIKENVLVEIVFGDQPKRSFLGFAVKLFPQLVRNAKFLIIRGVLENFIALVQVFAYALNGLQNLLANILWKKLRIQPVGHGPILIAVSNAFFLGRIPASELDRILREGLRAEPRDRRRV